MKTPKKYEINSFEKLCNVINEDNFESLTTDLVMWLAYQVQMVKKLRKELPKKYSKDKLNWDLCKTTFIWIDDGKHELKSITIKNELTGEISEMLINDKIKSQSKQQSE